MIKNNIYNTTKFHREIIEPNILFDQRWLWRIAIWFFFFEEELKPTRALKIVYLKGQKVLEGREHL